MRFGFSYVGFIYLVMLLVPNLIWAKNKPEDYALYAKNENRILLILEKAGEILVSAIVLVCSGCPVLKAGLCRQAQMVKPENPWGGLESPHRL